MSTQNEYDYLIIGAGFTGVVLAERLAAKPEKRILIIEKRNHVGGNAYDKYDEDGILVNKYGPHIFHTNSDEVFQYLSKFTRWRIYEHKVQAYYKGELYPIPINRLTINKLLKKNFSTKREVESYLDHVKEKRDPIINSEDIIVNQMGKELFETFFKDYTFKQWQKYPIELAPSVCGRIPIRSNDDCRYFSDKFQCMPIDGYTKMFERMIASPNVEIVLNTDYKNIISNINFSQMIYTGPIDYFFNYKFGKLPYRSIHFVFENYEKEKLQEIAVVNYVDKSVPFTRVTEYKHLTGQTSNSTTISREYTQISGEPFYPVPTSESKKLYKLYLGESKKIRNTIFCGRLAEYQYYNMDQVVANALKLANKISREVK